MMSALNGTQTCLPFRIKSGMMSALPPRPSLDFKKFMSSASSDFNGHLSTGKPLANPMTTTWTPNKFTIVKFRANARSPQPAEECHEPTKEIRARLA